MPSSPLTKTQVLDRYFLEHRAKLLDIAAFLDRIDRAAADPPNTPPQEDFRLAAFRSVLKRLADPQPSRTKQILEALSDPSDAPTTSDGGEGAAAGAYRGNGEANDGGESA